MQELILFLMTFVLVLIIYEIFIVSKTKRLRNTNSKKFKDPMEIKYLVNRYKLDMKKIDYNQLLQLVAIISSFDIALVVTLINLTNIFVLEILIGIVSIFPIILLSYHLVFIFYKKKGMIIND